MTPKGGPPRRTAPPRQRSATPAAPATQVGRRPSNPALLASLAVAWVACGVVALVRLTASWKLVPGIVFIGIGFLFLRAALATVVRRQGPGS